MVAKTKIRSELHYEPHHENSVFWMSYRVRHNSGCTTTEGGQRLEILDLGNRRIVPTIYVVKSKALISCAFVFAFEKSRFSHDTAHIRGLLRIFYIIFTLQLIQGGHLSVSNERMGTQINVTRINDCAGYDMKCVEGP